MQLLQEINSSIAEGIPYKSFKQKINIVKQELAKDRYIEVMDKPKIVYSAEKWRGNN